MVQDSSSPARDPLATQAPATPAPSGAAAAPGKLLEPEPVLAPPSLPDAPPVRLPSAATAPATPHALYMARRHFASLDGLRALGILAVVWHHTMGGPGRFGANLFFLLSGFLVTTILVRERARRGTVDLLRFRTRRVRRLYPLYFAVLVLYAAVVWLLEPPGEARSDFFAHLPAFATFTSNLFVDLDREHVIFYFAWSLAAQEQFYLAWPALLKRVRPRACVAGMVALLTLVYLTRADALNLVLPPGSVARTLVLSVMPALPLGALLALTLDARAGFAAVWRALGSRWAAPALLALALVLWRLPAAPEPLMHVVLAALTAACVLREDHLLARFLRLAPVVHIGTVSYGIYLLHMLCHNVAERCLARAGLGLGVLDFVLTAVLAVGVATASHRWFEDRFLPADKRAKPA